MKTTALVILATLISTGAQANTMGLDGPIGTVVIDSLTGNDNSVQMTAHFEWTGSIGGFGAQATGLFDTSNPLALSVSRDIQSFSVSFQPQWPSWPSYVGGNFFGFGFLPPGDTYSRTDTASFEVMDAVGQLWLVNRTAALNLTFAFPDISSGSGNISISETRVNLPDRASTAGLLLLGIGGLACGRRACRG
jgi:hypothetical protein